MKNLSFLTQSLKKKSLIALTTTTLATSLVFSQSAFAVTYGGSYTNSLTFTSNNELMNVTGVVNTNGQPGVDATGTPFVNTDFYLITNNPTTGITSIGAPALEVGGTSSIYNLNLGQGTMSSNSLNGTIYYHGAAPTQNLGRINIALSNTSTSTGTIINTNSGPAINYINASDDAQVFLFLRQGSTVRTTYTAADTTPTVINMVNSHNSTGGSFLIDTSSYQIDSIGSYIGVDGAPTNANITAVNFSRTNNSYKGSLLNFFTANSTVNGNITLNNDYVGIFLDNSTINGDIINLDGGERITFGLGTNPANRRTSQTSLMNGSIDFSVAGNGSSKSAALFSEGILTATNGHAITLSGNYTAAASSTDIIDNFYNLVKSSTNVDQVIIQPLSVGSVQILGGINGDGSNNARGSGLIAFRTNNYDLVGGIGQAAKVQYMQVKQVTVDAKTQNINSGTLEIENNSTFKTGSGSLTVSNNTGLSGIYLNGTTAGYANLDMTANRVTMTGNIFSTGYGNLYLGAIDNNPAIIETAFNHTNTGLTTLTATDRVSTGITGITPNAISNLTSSGRVTNSASTNLNVSIDYRQDTYNSGKYYYVLTGDSGSSATIQPVTDDNINIINIADGQTLADATNRAGVLTYHSRRDANNLVLYVSLADKTTISARPSEQNVFVAIDRIGANQTGEIKEMQTYIITSNLVTPTQRQDALASLTPNDIGLHKTVIDNSMASMVAAEKRLEEIRDRFRLGRKVQNDARFASSSSYKILDQNGNELYASEDDETSLYAALARSKKARKSTKDFNKNSSARDFNDNRSYVPPRNNLFTAWPSKSNGLWIQPIFTNARQETNKDFDGYTANSYGVTLGYDRMIAVNTVLGASVSAIKGDINTSGNLKESDINSYQFNLYAGEFCPTYFLDAVLGVAYNKYDSSRHMPVIGATAKASFSGNTYSGRARAGYITKPGRNWDFIPEVNLTYAKNNLGSYSENGAGTANLNVTNNDATFIEGAIGASVGYSGYAKKDEAFYPRLKVMYGYAFKGFEQSSNSGWIGQNFTFYTQSAKQSRSSIRADLGVNIFTLKSVIVSANYLYEYRTTDFRSHSGVLRVSYQF